MDTHLHAIQCMSAARLQTTRLSSADEGERLRLASMGKAKGWGHCVKSLPKNHAKNRARGLDVSTHRSMSSFGRCVRRYHYVRDRKSVV